MKIIGYEPYEGDYQGHHYEKMRFFLMNNITREGGKGIHVDIVSFKRSNLADLIESIGCRSIEETLQKEVEVLYNKYGQPVSFIRSDG